jgi:hypothetical protein
VNHSEPPWSKGVDAKQLRNSTWRHGWMCQQLVTRRRHQMNLADVPAESKLPKGTLAADWYASHLSKLFPKCNIRQVVEVLSDGIGFIEPNWSAISTIRGSDGGVGPMDDELLLERKISVKASRATMAQIGASDSPKFTTQRTIGGTLYEPGLFLVTENSVSFCHAGHSGRRALNSGSVSRWLPMVNEGDSADLPLKVPADHAPVAFSKETNRDIEKSLIGLTKDVLWKSLFHKTVAPSHCFSLVLIYSSLWQETAGVWALHVECAGGIGSPTTSVPISDLRALIEPAILCLEDVQGWSCEFEGTHRWKRYNVDFVNEALGRTRPPWTLDGIEYGAGRHHLYELDKAAYELSVDRLPSESIRDVFRQAVEEQYRLQNGSATPPSHTCRGDDIAKLILRAADGAVVGVRLDDVARQLTLETGSQQEANGISDLQSTPSLYLSGVERDLGLSGSDTDTPLQRGRKICEELGSLENQVSEGAKPRCAAVVRCLSQYLLKLDERQNPVADAQNPLPHEQRAVGGE